jgi:hypothetical protein
MPSTVAKILLRQFPNGTIKLRRTDAISGKKFFGTIANGLPHPGNVP